MDPYEPRAELPAEGGLPPTETPPSTPPGPNEPGIGQEGTPIPGAAPAPITPTEGAAAALPEPPAAAGTGHQGGGQPGNGWSARAYAQQLGVSGAERFSDDTSFVQALLLQANRARELEQLAPYAQEYLQHAADFQAYRQQQEAQKAAQATPAPAKFWNPPEWNPAWQNGLEADPTSGQIRVKPGYDPALLQKYTAYQNYRREFSEKLLSNPEETLAPLVESRAEQIAARQVQQHLAAYQEQAWTQNFLERNAGWLYATDEQTGQRLVHPQTGKPLLSPEGRRFREHLTAAEQRGIRDLAGQEEYARNLLALDVLRARYQTEQTQAAGAQQRQQVLQGANRAPSRNGALPAPGSPPASPNPNLSLKDQLRQAFAAHGITDADIDVAA